MAGYSDDEFGKPGIPSRKTTGSPSKDAADQVKSGNTAALAYPNFFPGQGGFQVDDDEFNGSLVFVAYFVTESDLAELETFKLT